MSEKNHCHSCDIGNKSGFFSLSVFILLMVTFAFTATKLLQAKPQDDEAVSITTNVDRTSQRYF
jgi:hypothetical protein